MTESSSTPSPTTSPDTWTTAYDSLILETISLCRTQARLIETMQSELTPATLGESYSLRPWIEDLTSLTTIAGSLLYAKSLTPTSETSKSTPESIQREENSGT